MGVLLFAIHDAVRGLRRDRAYTATVVLTLALTIGGTTAVFSIVDGVLLKPLAYPESDRLVTLREVWHEVADRVAALPVNERHLEYWREHSRSFDVLAQYLPLPANLTGAGDAVRIDVARTSGSLFAALGVTAALGRTLAPDDEPRERPDVVVIADRLWRQRLNADPAVVGRSLILDGKPYTVVGVLHQDFRLPVGELLSATVDAFVPLRVEVGWVGDHNNLAIGRLRSGVTLDGARAELDVLQRQVATIATAEAGEAVTLSAVTQPLMESVVGRARRAILLLFGAVVAVLLIACSNLANLSLTRALARGRDAAIRCAVGASRGHLIGRAVLEQVTLSLLGAGLGLWVAWAILALFVRAAPIDIPRMDEAAIDGRVVAFTVSVALGVGLLVAILPAWRTASHDVQATLRAGGAGAGSAAGGMKARATLLALQVTVSIALVVVTGLLSASLVRVLRSERGFNADHVLAASVALPAARYPDDQVRVAVYDRMLESIRALPAVRSVTVTSMLPLSGEGQVNLAVPEGAAGPRSEQPNANFRFVAPAYFQTLEIPIRRGRSFSDGERDRRRPAPAVISEPLAARLWPNQDPIGRRFSRGIDTEQGFEVVGVAADARTTAIERQPPLMVYVPYWWRNRASTSLLIKTASEPEAVVADLRRVIRDIDPGIALDRTRALSGLVTAATAGRRYQVELVAGFSLIALVIATIGVYAVTAFAVSRRRREMNIRAALGAHRAAMLGLMVRQSSVPVAVGVIGGLVVALGLGRVVAGLLYEVDARDPIILTLVTILVGSTALAAAFTAARRGMSLDPAAALRDE